MTRALRAVLLALGAALLAQGVVSVALDALDRQSDHLPGRVVNADPLHAAVHVVWGAVLLVAAWRDRGADLRRLALGFGVFYTALAVVGAIVHHPLGMRIDRGEEVFHLVAGPGVLALALVAWRSAAGGHGPVRRHPMLER